jgi:hypothetical protein
MSTFPDDWIELLAGTGLCLEAQGDVDAGRLVRLFRLGWGRVGPDEQAELLAFWRRGGRRLARLVPHGLRRPGGGPRDYLVSWMTWTQCELVFCDPLVATLPDWLVSQTVAGLLAQSLAGRRVRADASRDPRMFEFVGGLLRRWGYDRDDVGRW